MEEILAPGREMLPQQKPPTCGAAFGTGGRWKQVPGEATAEGLGGGKKPAAEHRGAGGPAVRGGSRGTTAGDRKCA